VILLLNRKYAFESRSSSAVCLYPIGTGAAVERSMDRKTSARVIFNPKSRVDPDMLSNT
jgi:hypothetical protein